MRFFPRTRRDGGESDGGMLRRDAEAAMRSAPRKHWSARCSEQAGAWRGLLPLVAETCGRSHEARGIEGEWRG